MPLSISLFDFDGFDGLIEETGSGLGVYFAACALVLAFVVAGSLAERRRRSPVERIVRRRYRA
jgi:hypothetical protein